MNVGINLYSKWPYEKIVKSFKENDIDRTFVCIDHPEFHSAMKFLKKNNICVDNFHAPFREINRIWSEERDGNELLKTYLDCVDICVKYDVPLMIAHVSSGRPMPPVNSCGIARIGKLISYADMRGVTVAIENHRYVENVKYIMDMFPQTAFCYDTCHAHGFTPGIDYISMWGNRLLATHISDNDNVCDKDMHMLPFDGIIDFDTIAKEFVKCGYNGTLMLEIKPDNHQLYSDMSIDMYYARASERIKRLKALVEKYKD